ncbi:hypothetical protein ABH922_004274 [Rhodococcus sp. 27YEA15]
MAPCLNYHEVVSVDGANETVLMIDSTRRCTGKCGFHWITPAAAISLSLHLPMTVGRPPVRPPHRRHTVEQMTCVGTFGQTLVHNEVPPTRTVRPTHDGGPAP